MNEKCVSCGIDAAVRVGGTSFCASCGVGQYQASNQLRRPNRRSRRAAFFALFSSGMVVKTLLGAVAVAAVGGVAASTVPQPEPTAVASPTTVTQAVEVVANADSGDSEVADAARVGEYVSAVQAWADCVGAGASAHSGGPFDPIASCGDRPRPADFDIAIDVPGHDEDGPGNSENAPGHDEDGPGNSENAPGRDEDGPGNSENAPGHDEGGPGNSENAPGHDEGGPGNSENAPGQRKNK